MAHAALEWQHDGGSRVAARQGDLPRFLLRDLLTRAMAVQGADTDASSLHLIVAVRSLALIDVIRQDVGEVPVTA